MYLGVDIGGTKTLVTALDKHGVIKEQIKFPTPQNYDDFGVEIKKALDSLETKDFVAGGLGMPGMLERDTGETVSFGNLPWKHVFIGHDVERIAKCPIAIENDAKLAGLSEAMLLKDRYDKVLYITVSTGIGVALTDKGKIDTSLGDSGGATLMLEHHGKLMPWEHFASGHAIVERFGKKAMDIHDEKTWKIIVHDIAKGLIELIAITEPDAIVIGGSVGTYFDRYGKLLKEELKNYHLPLMKIPPLMGAQRPEEAVIYGCYDYAKQVFPHASAH